MIAKKDTMEPWTKGGMDFPCIRDSWRAYKATWIRRMLNSEGTWIEALKAVMRPRFIIKNLQNFLVNISIIDLSKRLRYIRSEFWRDVFQQIAPLMSKYNQLYTNTLIYTNIWGNSLFKDHHGHILDANNNQQLAQKITYISELLIEEDGQTSWKTAEEVAACINHDEMEVNLMMDNLKMTLNLYDVNINNMKLQRPQRPAIVNLFMIKRKGCKFWKKMLRHRYGVAEGVRKREQKWSDCLGVSLSVRFWDDIYKNNVRLAFDPKIRYFQYRTSRLQLHTMYVRAKYDPLANPSCRLCGNDTETIVHLFWECEKTKSLIESYDNLMIVTNEDYRTEWNVRTFIFSNKFRDITRPFNIASLYMRKYIWKTACMRGTLNAHEFIRILRKQVETITKAFPHHKKLSSLPLVE